MSHEDLRSEKRFRAVPREESESQLRCKPAKLCMNYLTLFLLFPEHLTMVSSGHWRGRERWADIQVLSGLDGSQEVLFVCFQPSWLHTGDPNMGISLFVTSDLSLVWQHRTEPVSVSLDSNRAPPGGITLLSGLPLRSEGTWPWHNGAAPSSKEYSLDCLGKCGHPSRPYGGEHHLKWHAWSSKPWAAHPSQGLGLSILALNTILGWKGCWS